MSRNDMLLEQTELNPSYNSIKTELKPCDTPRNNLADTSQDCISRQEVNELVDELDRAISDERCYMSRGRSTAAIMQDIIDLPSVTPKAEWIPVTVRLPEEGEDVLVWYRYWRYGDYNDWYYTYGIGFQYTDIWSVIDGGTRTTVYAWMPLPPEPAKLED